MPSRVNPAEGEGLGNQGKIDPLVIDGRVAPGGGISAEGVTLGRPFCPSSPLH